MHFFWNDSSPTASTSSVIRMSGRMRRGDGEPEPHDHAGRVVLDRVVDVLADVGEGDDLVALRRDLGRARGRAAPRPGRCWRAPCTPDGSPEPSSSSAPTRPLHPHRAARRLDHAGDGLQQRRLAGAVLADDAERRAAVQVEAHVVERAKHVRGSASAQQVPDEPHAAAARFDLRVILADPGQREQCAHALPAALVCAPTPPEAAPGTSTAPSGGRAALIRNPRSAATAGGTRRGPRRTMRRRR